MQEHDGDAAAISALRALARSPNATPPAEGIALAQRRGWIARAGAHGPWRLTTAGRGALRRCRTGAATAPDTTGAACGPGTAAGQPSRARAESPLAWLHARRDRQGRRLIGHAQREAGERFCADFCHAQMSPRVTASWSTTPPAHGAPRATPGAGAEMADSVVAARQRVTAALEAVGPELGHILVDVCGLELGVEATERRLGWPQRSGKVVLGLALDRLARHYGIAPSVPNGDADHRSRHWGAADYRPTLDAWR